MKNIFGLSIAALELETGIAKDTLRVWERRYGFPQPVRGDRGERVYPVEQVARLRQMRRLLDQGLRPGQVLTLTPDELAERAQSYGAVEDSESVLIELLKRHDDAGVRQELRTRLLRDGLQQFVTHAVAPMLESVGDAWSRGDIEVFEEHHFSVQLDGVLHEAIAQLPVVNETPRVLLTTLPGEPHGLGLLLAHVLLRLEGATCISLGIQTPESQVDAAARAYGVDIVALSFSEYFAPGAMRDSVRRLRALLPTTTELWCGGSGALRLKRPPAGVTVIKTLSQITQDLAARAGR